MTIKDTLIKELDRSTRYFVNHMKEYAAQEISTPLTKDKWNMVQIIEHVILVDQSILTLLEQPFRKIKKGHFSKYQMRDLLLNRNAKIKNPEGVTPEGLKEQSITAWLDEFKEQRETLIERVQNDQFDLDSEAAYPHFQLGLLTYRDWLYLLCFHSDRHVAQMQEVLFCQPNS